MQKEYPELAIDGEMQVNFAMNRELRDTKYPFTRLKGKDVKDLFDIIARRGGEGVSKQVEVKIGKDGKAYGLKINGEKIDDSRLYTIATIDYIANGNDELIPFKNSVSRTDLDLRLRDVMLQYIADKTAKGEKLKASLDNRLIQEK